MARNIAVYLAYCMALGAIGAMVALILPGAYVIAMSL